MPSSSLHLGRRAAKIAPTLRDNSLAAGAEAPDGTGEEFRLFWMTFSGGLVVALTFLG